MEKLESLVSFKKNSLNKEMMSKIYGGIGAVLGAATGAGTVCVSTSVSASGCQAYTSDYSEFLNGQHYWSYAPGSDVNQPCTS